MPYLDEHRNANNSRELIGSGARGSTISLRELLAPGWAAQNSTLRGRHNYPVSVPTSRHRRPCVGGANDWPLQRRQRRSSAPTGPVPVERMIERRGALRGQSFRPPAQGRWSDVGSWRSRVVVNRLSTGTGPVEQCSPTPRNEEPHRVAELSSGKHASFAQPTAGLSARADQFFIVGGDSCRRLPENSGIIGDKSRLLQSRSGKLIGPGLSVGRVSAGRVDNFSPAW